MLFSWKKNKLGWWTDDSMYMWFSTIDSAYPKCYRSDTQYDVESQILNHMYIESAVQHPNWVKLFELYLFVYLPNTVFVYEPLYFGTFSIVLSLTPQMVNLISLIKRRKNITKEPLPPEVINMLKEINMN